MYEGNCDFEDNWKFEDSCEFEYNWDFEDNCEFVQSTATSVKSYSPAGTGLELSMST